MSANESVVYGVEDLTANVHGGSARRTRFRGRDAVQLGSVHAAFHIPRHTVNSSQGNLTWWVFPLEQVAPVSHMVHFDKYEPNYRVHCFLSDLEDRRDTQNSRFHFGYHTDWWRQPCARFVRNTVAQPDGQCRADIAPDHFAFKSRAWHRLTVTWDRSAGKFRMYVNGVRIEAETPFIPMIHEPCGTTLFGGNTAFAFGTLRFGDSFLSDDEVAAQYRSEAIEPDLELDAHLARVNRGDGLPPASWSPDASWKTQLDLTLTRESDLEHFVVQGAADAHRITPDGLLIDTKPAPSNFAGSFGTNKVENYLWTIRPFEGDLAVELEFNPLKSNGLSLLMFQSSGMQREDFMADYPMRENGSMSMVCWENVRNYHWEFFREIDNCRNDTASHLFVKNPWMAGLAYQCLPDYYAKNVWHKLQFIQEGARMRGIVDGTLIFDTTDAPVPFAGPILTFGRIALRCKYKTAMLYRNFKVHTREIAE
ncbi:DUF1961 family protein [Oscillatoria amoena NRMC-F 0135]|nr:DUF1961 family protein [Oscillatoria amoena NRMC-F 0135]